MAEISIIIPVYNTEPYLEECLQSVANQRFTDFEAIVVNDGSTDNSEAIIQKFVAADSRFKYRNQPNQGMATARNTGMKMATGSWFCFLDSDDILDPEFLSKTLIAAKENGADIACTGKQTFSEKVIRDADAPGEVLMLTPEEAAANSLYQNDRPDYSVWNKIYKAQCWENRIFPPGVYFEDMALTPRVLLKSSKVVFLTERLYNYRVRPESFITSNFNIKKAVIIDVAEKLYSEFGEISPLLKQAAASNLFSSCCSILMRTSPTQEFMEYRQRAFPWIKKLRSQILLDSRTRNRNKIAALLSYLPRPLFLKLLSRGLK